MATNFVCHVFWPHALRTDMLSALLLDVDSQIDRYPECGPAWMAPIGCWDLTPTKTWWQVVDEIYELDPVPIEHLRAKSAYLKTMEPRLFIVLCRLLHPQPKVYGEPPFEVTKDVRVTEWKEQVREQFNPRIYGPEGGRGVSTVNHVLHSTDTDDQARRLMKMFRLPNPDWLTRYDDAIIKCSPYIPEFGGHPEVMDIHDLMANQIAEDGHTIVSMPLHKTFAFRYIVGTENPEQDYREYNEYWERTRGKQCREWHTPMSADRLARTWKPTGTIEDAPVIDVDGKTILDGVHRLSVLCKHAIHRAKVVKVDRWIQQP